MRGWIAVVVVAMVLLVLLMGFYLAKFVKNETVGAIVDAYPEKDGLVLTVFVNGDFYKLYTNATSINMSKPVLIKFKDGKPILVMQDDKTYNVMNWTKLKTVRDVLKVLKTPFKEY